MRRVAFFVLFLFVLNGVNLWGQSDRATITGTVTDPSGAVVPGVAVTAINVDTGVRTNAVTNEAGIYSVLNLPIGKYSVSFDKEGFKKFERKGITLSVSQVGQLNVILDVGVRTDAMTVTDDLPLLQAETSDVGTNMKAPVVIDLPLDINGGRNLESFAYKITPSVQGDPWQSVVAGGQTFSKEILIDGTTATAQIQGSFYDTTPSMEAVEEFQVQTSGMGAQFGRTGGGAFIYSMKSGTNKFHGSAFGFMHNEITDANTWWRNHQGEDREKARFHSFGFSGGGPIFKNKTFFYSAYERYSQNDFRLNQPWATVPTSAFLNGDFSALLDTSTVLGTDGAGNTIYRGAIFDPQTRNVFVNNIIPQNRISSASQRVVEIYRQHYQPINNELRYNNALPLSNSPLEVNSSFSVKIDHNFSDNNKLNGSYIHHTLGRTLEDSGGIWEAGSEDGGPLATSRHQNGGGESIRLGHTYSFSPTLLNVFGVTYNRNKNYSDTLAKQENWPSFLGIGDTGIDNFPVIKFGDERNGVWTDSIGNSYVNDGYSGSTFALNDSVTWVKGRHAFSFGGEFRAMQINSRTDPGALTFQFSPNQTGNPTADYSTEVGFGFASFLLGAVESAQQGTAFNLYGRRKSVGFFADDTFKATDRLTLSLGLRWDVTFPFHEKFGHWANFDLNAINPVLGIPGVHVYAESGDDTFESKMDWKEFSPHIGAAFRITDKIIARGSYGIFYSPIAMNIWAGVPYSYAPGYRGTNLVNANADFTAAFNWDNGYPGTFVPGTKDPNYMTWGPVNIDPKSLYAGYTHQFNAGVQYELMKDLKLDLSYIGNLGRRLTGGTLDFNEPDWNTRRALYLSGHDWDWVSDEASAATAGVPYPYAGFSGYAYQAIAPYPQVPSQTWDGPVIYVGTPRGQSDYSALQAEVTKRTGKGLDLNFSYTLSRARSNSISNFQENWWYGGLQNYDDLSREARNYNPWDQTHVFKGYFSYQLPFGEGRRFLSGAKGVLNALAGGWTLTGIVRYGTGRPLRVYSSNWVPGWASFYPNINPEVDTSRKFDASKFNPDDSSDSGNLYFDPNIFSNPAPGELGTALAFSGKVRGFGDASEDMRIAKYVYFGQDRRFRMSLTFDLYNVFNRHGYGDPDTNINSTTFGYVTGVTGSPRQGQIGARFQW